MPLSAKNDLIKKEDESSKHLPKILLVDDREENLFALGDAIASPSFVVYKARSGQEALLQAQQHDFALILLDVQMPFMDGFECAQHLRKMPLSKQTPIIFLTAIYLDEAFMEKGYAVGAVDYLPKPLNIRVLCAKIAIFVELYLKSKKVELQEKQLRQADEREHSLRYAALSEREQKTYLKYRDLVESIPNCIIWAIDPVSREFTFVSPRAAELSGYSDQEWKDDPTFWEHALPSEDRERVFAVFEQAILENKDVAVEHQLIHKNGSVMCYHTSVRPVLSGPDSRIELRGLSVNISEIKKAHAALRENDERYKAMFLKAPAFIAVTRGPQHVLEVLNDVAKEIIQIPGLVGKPLPIAAPQRWVEQFEPLLDRVYQTGEIFVARDFCVQFSDFEAGRLIDRYFNFVLQPILDSQNQVSGIFNFAYEVTDQFLAREQMNQLTEDLRSAVESRDEFLSIASHELKTPITALKLGLQMAQRKFKTPFDITAAEKLPAILRGVNKQVDRLGSLIENLLDVTRLESGQLDYSFESVNLLELINDVCDQFLDEATMAKCPIVIRIDESLAGEWDRNRLEQVMVNLVSNAIKYAPGELIEIEAGTHDGVVELKIQDHGPGIPIDMRDKIFHRFERAAMSRNVTGLGLGLFIAHEIIKAHCGSIRVESGVTQGSNFIVQLPIQHVADEGATERMSVVRG